MDSCLTRKTVSDKISCMDNQRKFPDKCCAHCKWCTEQDWFELDGTCEKARSTDSESGKFTFLDHEACSEFELADLWKDMRVVCAEY